MHDAQGGIERIAVPEGGLMSYACDGKGKQVELRKRVKAPVFFPNGQVLKPGVDYAMPKAKLPRLNIFYHKSSS